MKINLVNKYLSSDIRPVFFLSPGRTATQWVAWVYDRLYRDVIGVHEAPPMIRDVGIAYHGRAIKLHHATKPLQRARGPNIQAAKNYFKKKIYVEANNNLFSLCAPLRRAFPGCFIVGIVRDVRTWIPSMSKRGYKNGVPWFPITETATPGPEKLAWVWRDKIDAFKDCVDQLIRYEDLVGDEGHVVINKLAEWIRVRHISKAEFDQVRSFKLNYTRKNKLHGWNKINTNVRARVREITIDLMMELYEGVTYGWL